MAVTMESMEYLNGICTLASNALYSEETGVMKLWGLWRKFVFLGNCVWEFDDNADHLHSWQLAETQEAKLHNIEASVVLLLPSHPTAVRLQINKDLVWFTLLHNSSEHSLPMCRILSRGGLVVESKLNLPLLLYMVWRHMHRWQDGWQLFYSQALVYWQDFLFLNLPFRSCKCL